MMGILGFAIILGSELGLTDKNLKQQFRCESYVYCFKSSALIPKECISGGKWYIILWLQGT